MPLTCLECKTRPRLSYVRATLCRECEREYRRFLDRFRYARSRPCARCGAMMEPGRQSANCKSCEAARARERRQRPGRRCPACQELLPKGRQFDYCADCASVRRRIARVGRVAWQGIVSSAREAK